jgi:hypothetical protein
LVEGDLLKDNLRLRLQDKARAKRQRDRIATFERGDEAGAVDRQVAGSNQRSASPLYGNRLMSQWRMKGA